MRPLAALALVGAVMAVAVATRPSSNRHAVRALNKRAIPAVILQEKLGKGGEAGRTLAEEQYADRALPNDSIASAQQQVAQKAFKSIQNGSAPSKSWQELCPKTPTVPRIVTSTGAATTNAGRMTALAIARTCVPGNCRLLAGAAGGGVWRTNDALAATPV